MDTTKRKILIVEDDSMLIDIYKMVMDKHHFDVQFIASGKEALKVVDDIEKDPTLKPDVFLLDLILPDMDGTEILKAIRHSSQSKDALVFILTNKERVGFQELGDAKPDEFFVKANTTPMQIVEVIENHLNKNHE